MVSVSLPLLSSLLRLSNSSTIIQEAKERHDTGLALIGYFYFNFRDTVKQDVCGLLTSLLAQFSTKFNDCYCTLSKLYLTHDAGSQQPSNVALAECLKEILKFPGLPAIYIIVDALDECSNTSRVPTAWEKVLELLEDLVSLKLLNLHICVTSCPAINIQSILEPLATFHLDQRMQRWRAHDKQLVIDMLSTKVNGM
jgi:hypothetical protein